MSVLEEHIISIFWVKEQAKQEITIHNFFGGTVILHLTVGSKSITFIFSLRDVIPSSCKI
jgi:hypothetical protein